MIQWRCAVTVGVPELRQQNSRSHGGLSYLSAVWAENNIKLFIVIYEEHKQYKNTYFYSMNVGDGNLFNDTA